MALAVNRPALINVKDPFRKGRPNTKKIIFLSMEGSVTEEEYFKIIMDLYSDVKTRIHFISVAEDAVRTPCKKRTKEQIEMLSKNRPKQLVERIENFKIRKKDEYEFDKYPEDEFWIITDVDKNWSEDIIDSRDKKSYKDEWNEAITMCDRENYRYVISNPTFEIWLLLHHDEANTKDKSYAITDTHEYDKSSSQYFRKRLKDLNVPLKKKKYINSLHYNQENVKSAIDRAKQLHVDRNDLCPKYFATTVYLLLDEIIKLKSEEEQNQNFQND